MSEFKRFGIYHNREWIIGSSADAGDLCARLVTAGMGFTCDYSRREGVPYSERWTIKRTD